MSSSLAFLREYKPANEVFRCGGKCRVSGGKQGDYCSLCRWLLRTLSKMGIGAYYDTAIDLVYRGNQNAERWQSEVALEIQKSTSELSFILDSAMQAHGLRTIYKRCDMDQPLTTLAYASPDTMIASMKTQAMVMVVNHYGGPIQPRIHCVPINAAYMLRELLMLPDEGTTEDAFAIIEKHTLPLETKPM